MFWSLFKKRDNSFEEEIKKSFSKVKEDMNAFGKWIKHLDVRDKHLFNEINEIKHNLSMIKKEMAFLQEMFNEEIVLRKDKQVFKKSAVYDKQTSVYPVENAVQTPVQTDNFYEIFKNLSSNEKVILFTLLNSEMKLSYEDLSLMLGKERSTIRGQINSIKQKTQGILEEITEKNGKKRVFIPEEIKEKLAKYAKVRLKSKEKKKEEIEEKNEK